MSPPPTTQRPSDHAGPRVLWLCTELDVPPLGGASIYSLGLARAVAAQGCRVTILGATECSPPVEDSVSWRVVGPLTRRRVRSACSVRPMMTARLDLRELRDALTKALTEGWDLVVLNHLVSGWAVPAVVRAVHKGYVKGWWYASQNDEVAIWRRSLIAAGVSWPERAARVCDLPRLAWTQRTIVRKADAVTGVTLADLGALAAVGARRLILAPPGRTTPDRTWLPPSASRQPGVIIAGSYTWRLKLANLRALMNEAAVRWDADGIPVTVAGRIADSDRAALAHKYPSVTFLGGVPDLRATYWRARLAILHEPLGGGFKIKSLDYVFSGLPIAATAGSLSGFPPDAIATFPTLSDLVREVPALLKDTARLDQLRERAREVAERRFDWTKSGRTLMAAMKDQRSRVPR